jgi:hypothetical protein
MTLVVGSVIPDIGFLVADTLLSVPFKFKGLEGPINGNFHALKVQILDCNTAVAFAGDVELALTLIRNLHAELIANSNVDVCVQLDEFYRKAIESSDPQSPVDCDFLCLQLARGERRLGHVTRNGLQYRSRAYIGDGEEYARMTALRRTYTPPKTQHVQQADGTFKEEPLFTSDGEIEFVEVADAMERLPHQRESGSLGSLGGIVTRVVDARISRELEYLQMGEASLTPEEGHSGYTVLASNSGVRGVGIYNRTGKLGFLFIVGDSEPCRLEHAETLRKFVEMAKDRYGLSLTGATWLD